MDKEKVIESEVQQKLVVNEPACDGDLVSGGEATVQSSSGELASEGVSEAFEAISEEPSRSTPPSSANDKREPTLIRVKDLKSRKEKKEQPPATVKRTRNMYMMIAILTTIIGLVTVPLAWVTWTVLSYSFPQSPGIRFFTQPKQPGETKDQLLKLTENNQWRAKMHYMSTQIRDMPKPAATPVGTGYSDPKIESDVLALLKNKKFGELNKVLENATTKERLQYRNGNERMDDLYTTLANPGEETDAAWQERLSLLQEWVAAEGKSAIPHVVLADFYIKYAWYARGSGWAQSVQEWQWDLFKSRLYSSTKQLELALLYGTPSPEWFSVAQVNILGAGRKADRPIYDSFTETGNSFYPNYAPLHTHKVYYLQPRWYGTNTEWVDYAAKAADAVGGEEGDKLYARMVSHVNNLYPNVYSANPTLSKDRVDRGNALLNKQYKGNK